MISTDHVTLISTDHVTLISTAWAAHDNAMDNTRAAASRPPLCGQYNWHVQPRPLKSTMHNSLKPAAHLMRSLVEITGPGRTFANHVKAADIKCMDELQAHTKFPELAPMWGKTLIGHVGVACTPYSSMSAILVKNKKQRRIHVID